jgi:aldose 1-epimerase
MSVQCEDFGVLPTGETVHLYTLENKKGMKAQISDLGCALVRLWVPDAQGNLADVVLGHATAEGYAVNNNFFGAFIGRSANSIKGASVEIDGVTYQLAKNDGGNNLHSIPHCMGLMMFEAQATTIDGSPALVLSRRVADG